MEHKQTSISKKEILLYLILTILIVLAWFSLVDRAAYGMNIDSLKNTTVAFVVIKGANALISLAENIPLIGPIMSPYNDFLDRMSWVMLISLMSLGLQKVIIVAVQSYIVNLALSLSFFIILANKFKAFLSKDSAVKAFKFFILLLIIRFSIPMMTLAINSIEASIYEVQAEVSQERVVELQNKLLDIQKILSDDRKAQEEKLNTENHLIAENQNLVQQKNELKEEITVIKHKNGELFGFSTYIISSKSEKIKKEIQVLEEKIIKIDNQIVKNENIISDNNSMFNFADTKAKVKTAIENLNFLMGEMFDVFLTWVIFFFFKNVFFPIFFLWILFKLSDNIFSVNNTGQISNGLVT